MNTKSKISIKYDNNKSKNLIIKSSKSNNAYSQLLSYDFQSFTFLTHPDQIQKEKQKLSKILLSSKAKTKHENQSNQQSQIQPKALLSVSLKKKSIIISSLYIKTSKILLNNVLIRSKQKRECGKLDYGKVSFEVSIESSKAITSKSIIELDKIDNLIHKYFQYKKYRNIRILFIIAILSSNSKIIKSKRQSYLFEFTNYQYSILSDYERKNISQYKNFQFQEIGYFEIIGSRNNNNLHIESIDYKDYIKYLINNQVIKITHNNKVEQYSIETFEMSFYIYKIESKNYNIIPIVSFTIQSRFENSYEEEDSFFSIKSNGGIEKLKLFSSLSSKSYKSQYLSGNPYQSISILKSLPKEEVIYSIYDNEYRENNCSRKNILMISLLKSIFHKTNQAKYSIIEHLILLKKKEMIILITSLMRVFQKGNKKLLLKKSYLTRNNACSTNWISIFKNRIIKSVFKLKYTQVNPIGDKNINNYSFLKKVLYVIKTKISYSFKRKYAYRNKKIIDCSVKHLDIVNQNVDKDISISNSETESFYSIQSIHEYELYMKNKLLSIRFILNIRKNHYYTSKSYFNSWRIINKCLLLTEIDYIAKKNNSIYTYSFSIDNTLPVIQIKIRNFLERLIKNIRKSVFSMMFSIMTIRKEGNLLSLMKNNHFSKISKFQYRIYKLQACLLKINQIKKIDLFLISNECIIEYLINNREKHSLSSISFIKTSILNLNLKMNLKRKDLKMKIKTIRQSEIFTKQVNYITYMSLFNINHSNSQDKIINLIKERLKNQIKKDCRQMKILEFIVRREKHTLCYLWIYLKRLFFISKYLNYSQSSRIIQKFFQEKSVYSNNRRQSKERLYKIMYFYILHCQIRPFFRDLTKTIKIISFSYIITKALLSLSLYSLIEYSYYKHYKARISRTDLIKIIKSNGKSSFSRILKASKVFDILLLKLGLERIKKCALYAKSVEVILSLYSIKLLSNIYFYFIKWKEMSKLQTQENDDISYNM